MKKDLYSGVNAGLLNIEIDNARNIMNIKSSEKLKHNNITLIFYKIRDLQQRKYGN